MKPRRIPLLLALAAALVPAAEPAAEDPFGPVFERLYNWDFPASLRRIDHYVSSAPEDPLGHSVRAAVLLFQEMGRLEILQGEFFADNRRITEKKKLKTDAELRRRLYDAVARARQLAEARLARDPGDRNALFALCMATGVATDYASFIEKKLWGALNTARESHAYALRLLHLDPGFYDAYLTTGLTEYLLGSVPFFVRWFVRFDEAKGDKNRAVTNLELVARKGRYYGPFAKVLLSVIHLREKRFPDSERLLVELSRDYPENPLIRTELAKLSARNRKAAAEAQGQ